MKLLFDQIVTKQAITKGWSCDKKYCVTVSAGTKYLLRITPYDKSNHLAAVFAILKKMSTLDIPMCRPVELGTCDDGVYTLYTWVEGKDARDVIPLLPQSEQYALGLKAGEIAKQIHTIPAPETQEDWYTRFHRKTDWKIMKYRGCGIRFDGDTKVMQYLADHRDVFKDRPQSFQHGDYHLGNMMIQDGKLVIIDFGGADFGDPWEEFNRIVWCAQPAPYFATGMIDGYFDQSPPIQFWDCLAFYIGSNTLSSIYWGMNFGQSDLDIMLKQAQDVLFWYDNFQTVIPNWYKRLGGSA